MVSKHTILKPYYIVFRFQKILLKHHDYLVAFPGVHLSLQ